MSTEERRALREGDRVKFRARNRASRRFPVQTFTFTVFRIERDGRTQTCYASAKHFGTIKFTWVVDSNYQSIHAFGASQALVYAGRGNTDADDV